MTPRDAYFAPHETVAVDEAIGQVSAELVAPYPPGIPVLAPGERITAEAVAGLHQARPTARRCGTPRTDPADLPGGRRPLIPCHDRRPSAAPRVAARNGADHGSGERSALPVQRRRADGASHDRPTR